MVVLPLHFTSDTVFALFQMGRPSPSWLSSSSSSLRISDVVPASRPFRMELSGVIGNNPRKRMLPALASCLSC